MDSKYKSYNDLAWTENWLADPNEYETESNLLIKFIQQYSSTTDCTLLHFGCGAGGHDTFFKKHFSITGVDLSNQMLEIAKNRHPEIEYIKGDMRTIQLDRKFDIVAIPDSIDYMVSEEDLLKAITNSATHLKKDGFLIIVSKIEENFQDNNFVYTAEKDGIDITLFENNYINKLKPNTYDATLIYLIREDDDLNIHSEVQELGIFPLHTWKKLFDDAGLSIQQIKTFEEAYQKYLMNEGEYPLTIFISKKE